MEFVEYELTKKNLEDFYRYNLSKQFTYQRLLVVLIIAIAVGIGNTANGVHIVLYSFLVRFSISAAIAFCIVFLVPYLLSKRRISRYLKSIADQKVTVTLKEDGLDLASSDKHSFLRWESIKTDEMLNNGASVIGIYIVLVDKNTCFIPATAFASYAEAVNFLGSIRSSRLKARGNTGALAKRNIAQGKPVEARDGSHLYKTGWLGLIPGAGFFVGFILFVQGLFKYKNKKLVLIGVAAMLVPLSFYFLINKLTKDTNFGRSGFRDIAQMQLNALVRDIEFYKLEKGVYPDSLQVFSEDSTFTSIYDPLSASGKEPYNYKKMGDKYTIFSSGFDTIPGTRDDIYPEVIVADSAKIGFIKDTTAVNK